MQCCSDIQAYGDTGNAKSVAVFGSLSCTHDGGHMQKSTRADGSVALLARRGTNCGGASATPDAAPTQDSSQSCRDCLSASLRSLRSCALCLCIAVVALAVRRQSQRCPFCLPPFAPPLLPAPFTPFLTPGHGDTNDTQAIHDELDEPWRGRVKPSSLCQPLLRLCRAFSRGQQHPRKQPPRPVPGEQRRTEHAGHSVNRPRGVHGTHGT